LSKLHEHVKFRDGWILPVDFNKKFAKFVEKEKRRAISDINKDCSILEMFLVREFSCRGPEHQPVCLYDFTTKIIILETIIIKTEQSLSDFVIDDYYTYDRA
jgi:hypothetical protein